MFRRILTILSLYVILSTFGAVFVMEATFHPSRRPLTPENENTMQNIAQAFHADLQDVRIQAEDGIPLYAWSVKPRNGNGNAILLLHGLADNRAGMAGYAELFLSHGYSILMPDARAHGKSGGNIATYGFLERNDVHLWFEWMVFNLQPHCIFGLGESMGAAQLLQALQTEPHFCAVIAESPFSNFREIAYDRVGQFFLTGPWLGRSLFRPTVELAFLYARWKYRINLEEISPLAAVRKTQVPVLLIHGNADSNIPLRHSELIAAQNHNVVLWMVPRAGHCGAFSNAPGEFEKRTVTWTQDHTRPLALSSGSTRY